MQLVLEGMGPCKCWTRRDESGLILAGHSCSDCIARGLDFLESLLYIDKVSSVSASVEGEDSCG